MRVGLATISSLLTIPGLWRGRRAVMMALSVIAVPVAASAQAPASSPAKDDWGVWTSLAVGRGSDNGYQLGAANLAEWVTHGPFAASVRWAGTFDLESGGTSDGSLLLGVHPIRGSHVNGVIAIGAGLSRGDDGPNSPSQKSVMALGGQLIFNAAIFGIGLDAFAGIGRGRHYHGLGLVIGIGGFHGASAGP